MKNINKFSKYKACEFKSEIPLDKIQKFIYDWHPYVIVKISLKHSLKFSK